MAAEFTPDPGEGTGLDEAIAAYLTACEVEGKTPRTVQAYAETLRRFRAICAAEGLPDRVAAFRPAHVYAFLKVIADGGVSLGTRHRRFRETRAFFSWCTRMGYTARNLWCFKTLSALCESRPPESLRAEGRRCGSMGDCFWSGWECSAGGDGI